MHYEEEDEDWEDEEEEDEDRLWRDDEWQCKGTLIENQFRKRSEN